MPSETSNYLRLIQVSGHELKGTKVETSEQWLVLKLQPQPTTEELTCKFNFKLFSQHSPSPSI